MNWWDLLKSPNSKWWDKISITIAEEGRSDSSGELENIISHLFNKLIRKNYGRKDTQKYIDEVYKIGQHKVMSVIHFYGIHFELKPHNFLPKMVVDVMPDLTYRPYTEGFIRTHSKYKKYENFEGFAVFKEHASTYTADKVYTVMYLSNGFLFKIASFRGEKFRPFFNKFIKGNIILEERNTKREKIPLRKIRARGI